MAFFFANKFVHNQLILQVCGARRANIAQNTWRTLKSTETFKYIFMAEKLIERN